MSSLRRILVLKNGIKDFEFVRYQTSGASSSRLEDKDKLVTIGDVSLKVRTPNNPELIPYGYANEELLQNQIMLRHLRWMMQKDQLKQDMFLIGPPGPMRARLALAYCELLEREVEYISLSRDTIEGDIKQRREIRGETAVYVDQCAVRAALNGRVLILDGIEKAERNVLPILNNLLENREMHLEDGRFLVSPTRYDQLSSRINAAELNRWRLERVHDDFRVIALGLPVPRYPGHPLDPPLRSRFQARVVRPEGYFSNLLPANAPPAYERVLGHAAAMRVLDSDPQHTGISPPVLGEEQLHKVFDLLTRAPALSPARALHTVNPHMFFSEQQAGLVAKSLARFDLGLGPSSSPSQSSAQRASQPYLFATTTPATTITSTSASVTVQLSNSINNDVIAFPVPGHSNASLGTTNLVPIDTQQRLLGEIMLAYSEGDVCLVGARGVGKSALVDEIAARTGSTCTHVMVHKDMTARDLLQQRTTSSNGDTAWRPAPLVAAAIAGRIAVLDGVHRLDPGALSVLRRLAHDRELTLPDGSRLIATDKLQSLCVARGLAYPPPSELGYLPIHPAFRMIILGEPPTQAHGNAWLTEETQTMFMTIPVPSLDAMDQRRIISEAAPRLEPATLDAIMRVAEVFANQNKTTATAPTSNSSSSLSAGNAPLVSLSLRQLLRLARRMQAHKGDSLHSNIERLCLSRFLPRTARAALAKALDDARIVPVTAPSSERTQFDLTATSMKAQAPTKDEVLVPQTLFYNNPTHITVLSDVYTDFQLGEHLLLMGNQGVGKNKIVDHFLQTLRLPREYMQLHRDSTVQTLTQQTSVRDGSIIYEDSPLVRAALFGRVAVIDEADKAPPHVTCVLKTLVEHGSLQLADGRQIMPVNDPRPESAELLRAHKDFRIIVLANRPGYPFLGHDFFASMGDVFSCHAVDNPGVEAELSMLKNYAPEVDVDILERLTKAFNELRTMADEGQLTYPYSLRELVAVSVHLQRYPNEGVERALQNVFAFDTFDHLNLQQIVAVLHRHGIPIGSLGKVALAPEIPLSHSRIGSWTRANAAKQCEVSIASLSNKSDGVAVSHTVAIEPQDSRTTTFGEGQWAWPLPLHYSQSVTGMTALQDNTAVVAMTRPAALLFARAPWSSARIVDISNWFPVQYRNPGVVTVIPTKIPNTIALSDGRLMYMMNTETASMTRTGTLTDRVVNIFSDEAARFVVVPVSGGRAVTFIPGGRELFVWNFANMTRARVTLPLDDSTLGIRSISSGADSLFVTVSPPLPTPDSTLRVYELRRNNADSEVFNMLDAVDASNRAGWVSVLPGRAPPAVVTRLHPELSAVAADTKSVLLSADVEGAIDVAVELPDAKENAIYRFDRREDFASPLPQSTAAAATVVAAYDPLSSLIIRKAKLAGLDSRTANNNNNNNMPFMEIYDLKAMTARIIHLDPTSPDGSHAQLVHACVLGDGRLVSVDTGRTLRLWEVAASALHKSLDSWLSMVGSGKGEKNLRAEKTRYSGLDTKGPKHGKRDSKNEPHVGGNTWAGGTGGRDTAGLGGKGGPYRLDAGHDVHQLSKEEKDAVPEHVKQAAKEMGQQAFMERLRDINMSAYDAQAYDVYSAAVRNEVQQLRVLLSSLQSKGEERAWLRYQTIGDLDDGRIVEGLTGEGNVFRRRGPPPPAMAGMPQEHPKRVEFILDLSGSMYRFNGHDGRLDRSMETACMLMEAFADAGPRFDFTISGHSGDGPRFSLVEKSEAPNNNKDRLKILQRAQAHAQYCVSGDHTLDSIKMAVARLAALPSDERVVIALSDANLDVYGISPARVAQLLTSDARVSVFLILIGSLGEQADTLVRALPAGRAYVCLDTRKIPGIVKQIFAASIKQ